MLKEPKRIIAEEPTAQEYSCNTIDKGTGICTSYAFGKQPVAASYCKVFQCTFCP